MMGSDQQKSQDSSPSGPCALWPVDLKLTHLDWNPEATLIHLQGQYVNTCELDYNILQKEIQNVPKTRAEVDIGQFCLVEDLTSARWFRGRVQNRKENQFDVFLVDHGNVLSVDIAHISSCSSSLLSLPPKIVCGFLSNVLLLQTCSHSVMGEYFLSLIGKSVRGFIKAILPHNVILLEAPDINFGLVKHGFGRHVDTNTFLFLAEMLTEVSLKANIDPSLDLAIEKPSGQKLISSTLKGYGEFLSFCGPHLSCGTRAKVRITAAFNVGLFYCQMTNMKNDLWQMSKKLAEICEHRTKKHSQMTSENLGQLCAVKGKDWKWYRGFLQFLPVNSEVTVFFIDYGFFESVHVESIHKLPPEFYSTPIMAFPCALSSLTDQDTALKTQQLSFLKAGLLGEVLDVEVIGFDKEGHLHTIALTGAEDKYAEEPELIQKPPSETVFEAVKAPPQGGYAYYETVMAEALANALKAEQIQVGSVFVGYVEYAQNPNHFWIRTQNRNDEFEEMMGKMTDHFSHMKLDEDILLNQKVGARCCALYEKDMHFYRSVVTDTLEHGAEVLYIDFGNIEKVPHMLIKNMPEMFASTSQFAVCCTLAHVFPLDDIWPSDTCDFFRKAVSNKALQIHVAQVGKTKLVVDLCEVGSNNSITEVLISSNLIEHIHIDHRMPNKDLKEKTRCLQHTMDVCGKPEQWDSCEQDENLSKNDISKATASFSAPSVMPGCEFPVHCSHISSPSDFWCQRLDKAPKLEKLMIELQQYYSAHTVPLKPGDLCCVAKSPQDGRWYRGFIVGKLKSHITVMLVDFGSTIQVREHSLQAVMPEHLCLERQAFRCSLYKLTEPADLEDCGDWSLEACVLLTDFVLNSADRLKCKVVSQLNVKNKGLCNVVHLYNTRTQQSITDTFIEQGLARGTSKQSGVSPESFVHSSFGLSSGNEEKVFVTHISSQCEVYCQLERNTEIVEELEKKISEEVEKIPQANTSDVKKLCLAKYLDGKWYRAVVLPTQSPLHLSVFFVDYGNTNVSEINQVRFIPKECVDLLCTPMQAVRCNLSLVPTEELYAAAKEWLNQAVLNKETKAIIQGKREDGSFDVELFDGETNINEKLKELIISLSPKPKAPVSFVKINLNNKLTTQQVEKKQKCKPKNVPQRKSSTSPTRPHGSNRNKEKTKKPLLNQNTRKKQQNTNKTNSSVSVKPQIQAQRPGECWDEIPKKTRPMEETQIPKASCFPNKKLTAGFRAKCFTSHIDSVNGFFLQLSQDEPAILKMGEDLNSDILRGSLSNVTSPRIDVLAEFEEDGALYRSAVKTLEGSSRFRVEFVDYGNSAVVGKEKIYSLPKEFQSQPRFSIPCSLLDPSSYENDASFIDAVMEKPLMVEFVSQCGNQWKVKLEIIEQEVGLDTMLERSFLAENEGETSQSLPETEEEMRSCAPDERSIKTSFIEVPAPVTMTTKLKVKTIRRSRRRCRRNKSDKKTETSLKTTHFPFLSPTVQARDTENATILSVQSDGSFYIRLTWTNGLLMDLEKRASDSIYKYKTVAREDVKPGLKCLVQVQDKMWHRAIVLHENEEKCKVFLVDHGITKDIPCGSIRQQCKNMKKFPNFAIVCKMNSLGFDDGEDAQKYWCENLKPIVGTEVRLVFIRHSEADDLWMVEIVLDGLFLTRQIKVSLQQIEKKILSPAETEATSAPQQLAFAPLDPDRPYSGFAAAVSTPFKFCVIPEDLLPIQKKVSIMLGNLLRETPPLPESHLLSGTCCLLKSDSKNKWCRAEIVCANTTIILKLVDHGQYECMPYCDFSDLRMLPAELANLPKVTCPCILRGVKPVGVDGQWTDEAAVFFQQLLDQKKLRIFFREFVSNSHWKVDILADGVHVAKELVDAGHADYMDILLGLRFQVESSCKLPQGPDSEEEQRSDVTATEGPEWKMSVDTDARARQCFLM